MRATLYALRLTHYVDLTIVRTPRTLLAVRYSLITTHYSLPNEAA
jgi:hypothetical protein